MKAPRYKEGARIKLGAQWPLQPQHEAAKLEPNKGYTVGFHIWKGGKWYVSLVETGPLHAYEEISFTHYESYLTV